MSSRLMGWLAAMVAILITVALIVNEITDAATRRWWSGHSMTTDTVSGLLVLLITVLVVNQLLNMRQDRQRSQAVAAQTAIMLAQADRSARSISSVCSRSGDPSDASDGLRTYLMMLLIGAAVFMDDPVGRRFLEQAQVLGGVMFGILEEMGKSTDSAATSDDGLDEAVKQLQREAAPLLHQLSPGFRDSIHRTGQTG